MTPDPDDRLAGPLLAFAAQMLVGSSFVAMEPLADFPFALGQAGRYAVAVVLIALVARGRVPRPRPRELAVLAGVAATGLVLFNLLSLEGVARSDPASIGVVVGCVPIVLALLAPLQRGDRPRAGLVAAGVVVAAGAALVQLSGAHPTWVAFAMAQGALACEAAFTLLPVPVLPRLGALGVSLWTCGLGTAMFAAWAIADHATPRLPDRPEAVALGWLTVAVTVTAFICWYGAVRRIGADRAGLLCGVVPISAALTGWAFGSRGLSPAQLVGALVVAVGVTIGMAVRPRTPHPPAAQ